MINITAQKVENIDIEVPSTGHEAYARILRDLGYQIQSIGGADFVGFCEACDALITAEGVYGFDDDGVYTCYKCMVATKGCDG